jgi:oligoendopeptidase F
VPLAARLLEQRRQQQGWDTLRYWDEALVDPAGNPKPVGDYDTLVAQARTMFDRMDPRLGAFWRMMQEGGFTDLKNRPGKAGGGFCTSFPSVGATPAERHAIWQRLERHYMPWTDYGDLEYPAKGGRWQAKPHIYRSPFYYIDYTLALCCALQFWVRSRLDPAGTLEDYVALCGRGGVAPFTELVRSAGLISPFAPGALEAVVREAQAALTG